MTEQEFDLLDELYFILSYDELMQKCDLSEQDLKSVLFQLLAKAWIKCYFPIEQEIGFDRLLFEENFRKYYYIATKAGLIAHNGKKV